MCLRSKSIFLTGVAQRQRRHSSLCLNALVVVKIDEAVDRTIGLRNGIGFMAADACCLEDREEILALAWQLRALARSALRLFLSQVKVAFEVYWNPRSLWSGN